MKCTFCANSSKRIHSNGEMPIAECNECSTFTHYRHRSMHHVSYHSSTECWSSSPACCCFPSAGSTAVINETLEIATNTSVRRYWGNSAYVCSTMVGIYAVCRADTRVLFYVDYHICMAGWLCVWSVREKSSAFSLFVSLALSFLIIKYEKSTDFRVFQRI